jgi:outer membrane protein TolC
LSVGLFVFIPRAVTAQENPNESENSFFNFPEITFFWERSEFRQSRKEDSDPKGSSSNLELPNVVFFWQRDSFAPKYYQSEALQIPRYPLPPEERLSFESVAEPTLSTRSLRPDYARFKAEFLRPLDSFLIPPSASIDDEAPQLSLQQALYHAFASNPSVQVRDLRLAIEEERMTQAESIFLPTLELSSEYAQSRFPQNAAEASANNLFPIGNDPRRFLSKTGVIEAALKGENPVGTQYEFYTNLRYNESTLTRTSNSALFQEEYSTNLGIRLTQPILRGSSRTVRETPIRIARINRQIAAADLKTELTTLAGRTLEAYFRWLEAAEIHNLRRWEKRTYEELAEIISRKVETGDASSRERLRIKIRLTRIDDRIFQAQEQLDLARQRLFAGFGHDFPVSDYAKSRPIGEMSPEIPQPSEAATIQAALAQSAEIKRYRKLIEIDEENLGLALDETRPSLNLVGGVEVRGLNDRPTSSVDYLASNQPVGYNVGLVYSRPWNNQSAEAKVREQRLTLRQNEIELTRIKQEIRHRIIGEIKQLEILRNRLDNITELQAGIGEEIKRENNLLETGQTTLSTVLEFYEELFQVRGQYLAILSQINEAKSKLWTADQSLLERLGVEYYSSTGNR